VGAVAGMAVGVGDLLGVEDEPEFELLFLAPFPMLKLSLTLRSSSLRLLNFRL
jgi:hypothetical protein